MSSNTNELYGVPLKIEEPMVAPDEIVAMAETVRTQYHAERLKDARIAYVIKPGSDREGARVELGKAKACSKIEKLLSSFDFVVTLNWFAWQELDDRKRRALLDHELTHCEPKIDGEGFRKGWQLRRHDVEDFVEIVHRRGLWTGDLEALAPVAAKKHALMEKRRKAAKRQGKLKFTGGQKTAEPVATAAS